MKEEIQSEHLLRCTFGTSDCWIDGQSLSKAYHRHWSTKVNQVNFDGDKMNSHMASRTQRMMRHDKHNTPGTDTTTTHSCGLDVSALSNKQNTYRSSGILLSHSNKFPLHFYPATSWWPTQEALCQRKKTSQIKVYFGVDLSKETDPSEYKVYHNETDKLGIKLNLN